MEMLVLARAKYLLDRVSNNVRYPTLDGSPALPAEAAALIECLGELGLGEDADAMRKDFIVYFAHEVRLPNTGLDPRLVEFRSTANELFGPFLKYSRPEGDCTVVRLRLIDHFDGLRITFRKLSLLFPDERESAKTKRQGEQKGENADEKIISALVEHHKYEKGSVGNYEPARWVDIAKLADVSKSTVTKSLKRMGVFGEKRIYKNYCASCANRKIADKLKMLRKEFSDMTILSPEDAETYMAWMKEH